MFRTVSQAYILVSHKIKTTQRRRTVWTKLGVLTSPQEIMVDHARRLMAHGRRPTSTPESVRYGQRLRIVERN